MLNGVAQIRALVISRRDATPLPAWVHDNRWTRIPNFIAFGAALLALFVAARIARRGLPFRSVFKDKLSIRQQ